MLIVLPDGHDCPRCGSWHAEIRFVGRHASPHSRAAALTVAEFHCATCGYLFDGATHDVLEHRLACLWEIAA